ncbi:MAG: DUF72 domain-containing protein [Myxococcota bacterium]
MARVLVGTSSWTDKSLVASGWYPRSARTAEQRLRHYASIFKLVEVDSTYYFPPSEKNSELWVQRTSPDFTFNVKAFSLLTGHPAKADALYKDLPLPRGKTQLYPHDVDPEVMEEVWERFLSALLPLHHAGRLGALLFQFPPWFVIGRESKEYVLQCASRAAPMRICVEFRNRTWLSPENREETLQFLSTHRLPYVAVDMPQGFTSSVPRVMAATADLAVMRFHGHNDAEWESKDVQKRFRYLYSHEELVELVPSLEKLVEQSETTHLLFNNCYRDYAQQNALDLLHLLQDRGLPVPEATAPPPAEEEPARPVNLELPGLHGEGRSG